MSHFIFKVLLVALPCKSTYSNHLSPWGIPYLAISLLSSYLPALSFSPKC